MHLSNFMVIACLLVHFPTRLWPSRRWELCLIHASIPCPWSHSWTERSICWMNEHGIYGHVGDLAFWAKLRTNAKAFSPSYIKALLLTSFILKPDQCDTLPQTDSVKKCEYSCKKLFRSIVVLVIKFHAISRYNW